MKKSFLVLLLVALFLPGCSSSVKSQNSDSSDRVYSEEELFVLAQEEIQKCMLEKGFDYEPELFASALANLGSIEDIVLFKGRSLDELGYGITYGSLTVRFLPRPNMSVLSWGEVQEYNKALLGESRQHGESLDDLSTQEDLDLGCKGVGDEFFRSLADGKLSSADRSRLANEYSERLTASPEFLEFSSAWHSCMIEEGIEPGGADIFSHTTAYALEMLEKSLRKNFDSAQQKEAEKVMAGSRSFSESKFFSLLEVLPKYKAQYEIEIETAQVDFACREENAAIIQEISAKAMASVLATGE